MRLCPAGRNLPSPSFFPSCCPWRLLDLRSVQVSSLHSVPREKQPLLSAAGGALGRVTLDTPRASRSRAAAGSALPSRRVPLPLGQPHSRPPPLRRRPAAAAAIFPRRGAVAGRPGGARSRDAGGGARGGARPRGCCPFLSRARPGPGRCPFPSRAQALSPWVQPRRRGCSAVCGTGCGPRSRADLPGRGRQIQLHKLLHFVSLAALV